MKRVFAALLVLLMASAFVFAQAGAEATSTSGSNEIAWPKVMTFGTAGTGGAYYSNGVAMGTLFEKYLPTKVTVEITGGAIENVVLMSQGELDIAMTNEHLGYFANHQMSPYENLTNPQFCVLSAGLTPGVIQFVVGGNSPIKTPADLKGKVVAVGTQGNGSLSTIKAVLGFYGITFDDFTPSYLNYTEGCQGILDGTVDCCIVPAWAPAAAVTQLAASGKAYKIIDVDLREEFVAQNPFYITWDIEPNVYQNQDYTVKTLATANVIIVRKDLSEDIVYELTKCLWEHIEEVYTAVPGLRYSLKLENALNTTCEIHPGAMKYYREIGLVK
ncbi:MAG: TAXI family TRAP transporter solute-binding subunit [Spirochaetales bacterium]|nr:TAXI family TRAP transporter solute-binding subunit [Spirochaetales bacterium]